MTWLDLVHEYFPDITDDRCDIILWNLTAFPMGDIETIRQQLQHVKDVGFTQAFKDVDDEIQMVLDQMKNSPQED